MKPADDVIVLGSMDRSDVEYLAAYLARHGELDPARIDRWWMLRSWLEYLLAGRSAATTVHGFEEECARGPAHDGACIALHPTHPSMMGGRWDPRQGA